MKFVVGQAELNVIQFNEYKLHTIRFKYINYFNRTLIYTPMAKYLGDNRYTLSAIIPYNTSQGNAFIWHRGLSTYTQETIRNSWSSLEIGYFW